MEALAYTCFNRLVAIRFMEIHEYLENGEGGASYRVLSHPEGKPTPEILDKAEHVELPDLKKPLVIELKLDGKETELYRLLLIAQCNALHAAMPFLFEPIADETELVLPESLLHTDSIHPQARRAASTEEDWREKSRSSAGSTSPTSPSTTRPSSARWWPVPTSRRRPNASRRSG